MTSKKKQKQVNNGSWSYTLKGGIIGLCVFLFSLIASIFESIFNIDLYVTKPTQLILAASDKWMNLGDMLKPYNPTFANAAYFAFTLILIWGFYYLVGALVGYLIGKANNKKEKIERFYEDE